MTNIKAWDWTEILIDDKKLFRGYQLPGFNLKLASHFVDTHHFVVDAVHELDQIRQDLQC